MKTPILLASAGALAASFAILPTCAADPWPVEISSTGVCIDRMPEAVVAERMEACSTELAAASCTPRIGEWPGDHESRDVAERWLGERCREQLLAKRPASPHTRIRVDLRPDAGGNLFASAASRREDVLSCFPTLEPVAIPDDWTGTEWYPAAVRPGGTVSADRLRRFDRALQAGDAWTWPSHHRGCDEEPMTADDLTCAQFVERMGCR